MLKRTHKCGDLRLEDAGRPATLSGWVANWRDHGGLVFIDLRDRTGITQVVFKPDTDAELHARARALRSEYCISVQGRVEQRPAEMENPDLPTGQVEVNARQMELHSASEPPPIDVESGEDVSMDVRLRYRYLDLRRPAMQHNLERRHRLMQSTRRHLDEQGFIEVETPFLTKSTPEGARDYLVPSRVQPGRFYALPQSPQLFKQLLMAGGLDRYFQIVKCFRDEDLRANRQPEFTQIDIEMSFVDEADVQAMTEGLVARLFADLGKGEPALPLPRITYHEAFDRFGTDAPDMRFGLELRDITDVARECEFRVFQQAAAGGALVRGLCVPGGAAMPRSQVDELVEWTRQLGAGGLAWLKLRDGRPEGGISKFLKPGELDAICRRLNAGDGALLLFVAERRYLSNLTLSHLRLRLGRELGLLEGAPDALCWVVEPPAFEPDEVTGRLTFVHHPFTSPSQDALDRLETDPASVPARAYDLVMNGQEIAGGSIRINDPALQMRVFRLLGYTEEQVEERFGFFMRALRYGVPPHGGIAFGFDRTAMTFLGIEDIREVIAFPKTQRAVCLLTDAPSEVDETQLRELGIRRRED
ncbi:MAG: aspartate--tRNA ligase [Candidatus Brocadiaceae bacterium]|nr:aspartate--tRNA ligase [Candidatus Brocadiaceae bacterium]